MISGERDWEVVMPTYVILLRNSERGALQMIGTGAAGAKEQGVAVEAYGGSVRCQYALSGRYDTLLVIDFPDEVSCFAFGQAATYGGQYAETMRAFTPEEVQAAHEKVGEARKQMAETFSVQIDSSEGEGEERQL
jgi:uncharacterized protein with GYD domain